MSTNTTTGTREWSNASYNIGRGCCHNCLYCYARQMAQDYGWIGGPQRWATEAMKEKKAPIPRKKGVVMYPTMHDISPYYLDASIAAIKALIAAENKVLVVTKPHYDCVVKLCEGLAEHKHRILFRFTIGTLDTALAKLWEPGAPSPAERLGCLVWAHAQGFATSVSMEPMLAGKDDAIATYRSIDPWVTEKIWFGKMNQVDERVAKTTPAIAAACRLIQDQQSDEEILELVAALADQPKIQWKDSIKEVIARSRQPSGTRRAPTTSDLPPELPF